MRNKLEKCTHNVRECTAELEGTKRRSISVEDEELKDYAQVVYQQREQKIKKEEQMFRMEI